jgi:hypothetical protein
VAAGGRGRMPARPRDAGVNVKCRSQVKGSPKKGGEPAASDDRTTSSSHARLTPSLVVVMLKLYGRLNRKHEHTRTPRSRNGLEQLELR